MGITLAVSVGSNFSVDDLSTEQGCRRAFDRLLEMSDEELGRQDIMLVNLLCAVGLPSSDPLDIPQCLAQIDEWTEYVRQETINGFPRYLRNPNPNKGSENLYKLWAVMHAIRTHYGIEALIRTAVNREVADTSMKPTGGPYRNRINSQVGFIHGLLSPRRLGSCSSLPVLFAAVGRRLGYPVKLALTVQHIFNRWVDDSEEFNMDGSMDFIGGDEYHHYINRYRPWRDWERKSTAFHRPITPREELAAFVFNRSITECANLRFDEALASCKIAARLSPDNYAYVEEQWTVEGYREIKRRREGVAWLLPEMPVMLSATPQSQPSKTQNPQPFFTYLGNPVFHYGPQKRSPKP